LETPDHFLAVGMLGHERKQVEVPLGVADDTGEVVDLKQAQVTVIILDAFLLEIVALLGGKLVTFAARLGSLSAALVIHQEGLAIVRPLAIRTPGDFHLEDTEVDPKLQFFPPVETDDLAHLDGARFMRPIPEQRIEIKTHVVNNVRTLWGLLSMGTQANSDQ
jgi:hypothetical protein